jgi:hypothetical protein
MVEFKLLNTCLYCHKDYNPNLANHYFYDCLQVCEQCNNLKGIWSFRFNYESETYKQWKESGTYGQLPKTGHKKICGSCEDKNTADPVRRLQRAVANLKPGQLELMLKATKKE